MKVFALILLLALVGCLNIDEIEVIDPDAPKVEEIEEVENDPPVLEVSKLEAPHDLARPFKISEVNNEDSIISPFGVVRHSQDEGMGHGGIDIPLEKGADIYAVADAEVIKISRATDGKRGFDVILLIDGGDGEGWGFLYEHIDPIVSFGEQVDKGQIIGVNALLPGQGANHFQLTYLFNDYEYYKNHQCWVDLLEDKKDFMVFFDRFPKLADRWYDVFEDGYYPYRGLLGVNSSEPPKPCYEYGTDVRSTI